jgi:hypothetical protein
VNKYLDLKNITNDLKIEIKKFMEYKFYQKKEITQGDEEEVKKKLS